MTLKSLLLCLFLLLGACSTVQHPLELKEIIPPVCTLDAFNALPLNYIKCTCVGNNTFNCAVSTLELHQFIT